MLSSSDLNTPPTSSLSARQRISGGGLSEAQKNHSNELMIKSREAISRLTNELELERGKVQNLTADTAALKRELAQERGVIHGLQQDVAGNNERDQLLMRELGVLNGNYKLLKAKHEDALRELAQHRHQHQQAQETVQRLQAEISSVNAQNNVYVEQLAGNKGLAEEAVAKLTQQTEALLLSEHQLTAQLAEKDGLIASQSEMLSLADEQLTALESAQQASELQLSETKTAHLTQVTELQKTIKELTQSVQTHTIHEQTLEKEEHALEEKQSATGQALAKALAEKEDLSNQVTTLTESLTAVTSERDALQNEKGILTAAIDQAKTEGANVETRVQSSVNAQLETQATKLALAHAAEKSALVEAHRVELQRVKDEARESESELKDQLRELEYTVKFMTKIADDVKAAEATSSVSGGGSNQQFASDDVGSRHESKLALSSSPENLMQAAEAKSALAQQLALSEKEVVYLTSELAVVKGQLGTSQSKRKALKTKYEGELLRLKTHYTQKLLHVKQTASATRAKLQQSHDTLLEEIETKYRANLKRAKEHISQGHAKTHAVENELHLAREKLAAQTATVTALTARLDAASIVPVPAVKDNYVVSDQEMALQVLERRLAAEKKLRRAAEEESRRLASRKSTSSHTTTTSSTTRQAAAVVEQKREAPPVQATSSSHNELMNKLNGLIQKVEVQLVENNRRTTNPELMGGRM